jgi:hypothetical protein
MKTIILAMSFLVSSVAFSAEAPKGLGQFDPQQCGCETCFTKYGVCTAVNQGNERKDVSSRTPAKKGAKSSKVRGQ